MKDADKLPSIPPLLFEGDDTPVLPDPDHQPEQILRDNSPAENLAAEPQRLPDTYGSGRLLLLARDPHHLYAHWDAPASSSASPEVHVRVYAESAADGPVAEAPLDAVSKHCFVPVPDGGSSYVAELGYYKASTWQPLARSAAAETPPGVESLDRTASFARLPNAESVAFSDAPMSHPSPPAAEVTAPPRVAWLPLLNPADASNLSQGFSPEAGPSALMDTLESPPWTPEQERALAEFSGTASVPLESPTSPAPTVSSLFGGEQSQAPDFWLRVDADLIVHGATQSGAMVSICGQPVEARADGTFSCRLSLPDGEYQLTVKAASVKGDTRSVVLGVTRRTEVDPSG